jgi:hypothetical protein
MAPSPYLRRSRLIPHAIRPRASNLGTEIRAITGELERETFYREYPYLTLYFSQTHQVQLPFHQDLFKTAFLCSSTGLLWLNGWTIVEAVMFHRVVLRYGRILWFIEK